MKAKLFGILSAAILLGTLLMPSFAKASANPVLDSNVAYRGRAESFVIIPEDTDLFQNFKNVMPGDTLTQDIRVANESTNIMPVRIYLRAEPIDSSDRPFLEQMNLRVEHNLLGEISEGPASSQAGLAENVLLGTFFPGSDRQLEVSLEVPLSMGNEFQNAVGEVVWIFTVEEDDLPPLPQTGLQTTAKWMAIGLLILGAGLLLFVLRRHRKEQP